MVNFLKSLHILLKKEHLVHWGMTVISIASSSKNQKISLPQSDLRKKNEEMQVRLAVH